VAALQMHGYKIAVKIKLRKTMVKPVVVGGSETWALIELDMKRLSTWERRILRKLYGPVVE
jgi:hypothetical protein